ILPTCSGSTRISHWPLLSNRRRKQATVTEQRRRDPRWPEPESRSTNDMTVTARALQLYVLPSAPAAPCNARSRARHRFGDERRTSPGSRGRTIGPRSPWPARLAVQFRPLFLHDFDDPLEVAIAADAFKEGIQPC